MVLVGPKNDIISNKETNKRLIALTKGLQRTILNPSNDVLVLESSTKTITNH